MAKNTYVIMGATGQIGSIIVQQLVKQGHQVKAIGRDKNKLAFLKSKGVEVLQTARFDDEAFLTNAFKGCDAVFGMIPPGFQADNFLAFQDKVGEAIKTALQKNSISHLVNLSSIGAHLATGTGPIKGLHNQEERLNTLSDLNVVHFRPGYFMENLLWTIPTIKETKQLQTLLSPKLAIPMVSVDDIGIKIGELLNLLNFTGHTVFEFVGPREKPLTIEEITRVLGEAIGIPDLKYQQQTEEATKRIMSAFGVKSSVIEALLEMYRAFNEGECSPTQELTPEHRGKITIEQFAKKFERAFKQQPVTV
jgi:uncharacterized protein YbjT (DUF2867 family)